MCVCVCVCVCVDGMNLKYALRWHIDIGKIQGDGPKFPGPVLKVILGHKVSSQSLNGSPYSQNLQQRVSFFFSSYFFFVSSSRRMLPFDV